MYSLFSFWGKLEKEEEKIWEKNFTEKKKYWI